MSCRPSIIKSSSWCCESHSVCQVADGDSGGNSSITGIDSKLLPAHSGSAPPASLKSRCLKTSSGLAECHDNVAGPGGAHGQHDTR